MDSTCTSGDRLCFRIPFSSLAGSRRTDELELPIARPGPSATSLPVLITSRGGGTGMNVRQSQRNPTIEMTDEEVARIDEARVPLLPSSDRINAITSSAAEKLAQLDRVHPCAVCEMTFANGGVIDVPLSDLLLQAMRWHLRPPAIDISGHVLRQYDASVIDTRLAGILLYPPGVSRERGVSLKMCAACHDCLNRKNSTLPRLAIANGNYIGWYDGDKLTWLDEQMVALVSACVSMTSIAGGRHRCIRSHHYVVKNTAGPPVCMLPGNAADHIRVAMVGAMTPEQIAKCKKRYAVNVERCKQALAFLCNEHASYKLDGIRSSGETRLAGAQDVDVVIDRTRNSADPVDQLSVDDMEDTTSYNVPDSTRSAGSNVECVWIEERTALLDDHSQASDFFFRKSSIFESPQRWEHAVKMFPMLFPGGRGGPSEPRKQQYSLRTWVLRCLRLHRNRFEEHEVFLLLAFDYLALEAARQRMFVRLKASTDAVVAGQVTPAIMRECMEYRKHIEEASAAGVSPRPPSTAIATIIKLQRGVNAGEVGYYASDKSRAHGRNDIFGFINRLGPLQLFFTISPDSAGTYTITSRTGRLDTSAVELANAHLLPTRTTRRATATTHPFQCAIYFDEVMAIVIEDILGWSREHQRPKRDGGLFGMVRAFAASAETQVSGDLHAHFAVWLHGFPTSATENEVALKDADYRQHLAKFVDSITTTVVPGLTDKCLSPECGGTIQSVELPDKAYQKPKSGDGPCAIGVCNQCRTEYTSERLLDSATPETMTTAEADYIRCRTPRSEPISDQDLNVIIKDVQVHRWTHTKSCFKVCTFYPATATLLLTECDVNQITRRNPTGSYCRFERPVPANPNATYVNEAYEVVHHRPVGSEYVNPYNKSLTSVFRCNHDLRLVLSSTSKDVAAYICKYVMKPQNRIENETAHALATYERAVNSTNARIEPTDDNARSRGNSVYASWLYHLTNQQDVAASLAALFVHRESAFWFSHEVVRIHLQQLLASYDRSDSGEATVQVSPEVAHRDVPVYEYRNALQNYWNRPTSMENLSLVDVLEWYDAKSGLYTKRSTKRILVICGKALPDISVCENREERESYFKALLMLYQPSRADHHCEPAVSFEDEHAAFLQEGPPRATEQARAHACRLADSYSARRATAQAEDVPLGGSTNRYSCTAGLAMDRPEHDDEEEDLDAPDHDIEMPIPTVDEQFSRHDSLLRMEDGLHEAIQSSARQQLANFDEQRHGVFSLPSRNNEPEELEDSNVNGTSEFLRVFQTHESQLQQLSSYMNPISWIDPTTVPELRHDSLPDFASISDVSRAFKLNLLQHTAFETTARHVLEAFAKDIAAEANIPLPQPTSASGLKRQLIGFLGGEAGTGKSQVINALLHFATLWKREGSVEAIAYTGVAANNIRGKTVHSARNIPVNAVKRSNISDEMRSKFSRVVLTICDEISMLPQPLLGRADAATHELAPPDLNLPWGGRHLLFCGDWMQIPPVKARPCYAHTTETHARAARQGYALYSRINFVVFLMENMRSRLDATYTAILNRLRWGRTTAQDVATLNSRVGESPSRGQDTPWYFHPAVVSTNQLRCAVNHIMTYQTAASHGTDLYECLATPTSSRSVSTLKNVQHLDDSCTERIPLKLLYFIGMPVMLSQRSKPTEHATANGTLAFIAGHNLTTETDADIQEQRNGCVVRVLRNTPRRLIIYIPGTKTRSNEALPLGYHYIEPIQKSIEVDIPRTANHQRKRRRSPTLTIRQFALVPAFACTPEKLQGLTCHDGITLLKLERANIPSQSLYVALSRTTTLDKLVLTRPIDTNYLRSFKPQSDAIAEIRRLLSHIHIPPYVLPSSREQILQWVQSQLAS